jgi:hypothetical protein
VAGAVEKRATGTAQHKRDCAKIRAIVRFSINALKSVSAQGDGRGNAGRGGSGPPKTRDKRDRDHRVTVEIRAAFPALSRQGASVT